MSIREVISTSVSPVSNSTLISLNFSELISRPSSLHFSIDEVETGREIIASCFPELTNLRMIFHFVADTRAQKSAPMEIIRLKSQ